MVTNLLILGVGLGVDVVRRCEDVEEGGGTPDTLDLVDVGLGGGKEAAAGLGGDVHHAALLSQEQLAVLQLVKEARRPAKPVRGRAVVLTRWKPLISILFSATS